MFLPSMDDCFRIMNNGSIYKYKYKYNLPTGVIHFVPFAGRLQQHPFSVGKEVIHQHRVHSQRDVDLLAMKCPRTKLKTMLRKVHSQRYWNLKIYLKSADIYDNVFIIYILQ